VSREPGEHGSRLPWWISLAFARAIRALIRVSGRSGGTTLPGRVLLALRPDAIERLAGRLPDGSILVSSTNGKTTTAAMIASILAASGHEVVHNRAGSNMHWGVATALLDSTKLPANAIGLFEIDEAWVSKLAPRLAPRLVVLGNLFRDQLDRYGELERLSDEWAAMIAALPPACGVVLCADDPSIADLATSLQSDQTPVFFGMEDRSMVLSEQSHAFDAKHCRRCGGKYVYERTFIGHLGHYSCSQCGHRRPDDIQVVAQSVRLDGLTGSEFEFETPSGSASVEIPLPGLYNVYNALAAIATGHALEISTGEIVTGLSTTRAVFGRSETIEMVGGSVSLLLIKNPTGANEVLRTLLDEAGPRGSLDLWIGLNDRIADGRDVSWIWDADFEVLADHVRSATCSGSRAPEMALRLKYAGWPVDRIAVDPNLENSLSTAVSGAEGTVYALPTYTALLDVRGKIAEDGQADEFWA
jgi:UDP-N-acetylmuramyl tripeptide synthase